MWKVSETGENSRQIKSAYEWVAVHLGERDPAHYNCKRES